MDEELQALEAELKRLAPRRPEAGLLRRIERDLAPRRRLRLAWIALPLAAGAVAAFVLRPQPAAKSPATARGALATTGAPANPPLFKPVKVDNVLYATRDDGIVTLADGQPARRLRKAYLDTVVWRDPQSNASLRWTVPRSEVVVTPVSFQ
jgi:hypothetical protein